MQRRQGAIYPKLSLASHNKDWQKIFFYCKDKSPEKEARLPRYSLGHLEMTPVMIAKASAESRIRIEPLVDRTQALMAHGLTGLNLIRCWVS